MVKGLQRKYCYDHDRYHRSVSGIVTDLKIILPSLVGCVVSSQMLESLARISPICEEGLISKAIQDLKMQGWLKRSPDGRHWVILNKGD